jgi:hypothetical protein
LQTGQTSITFPTGTDAALSILPPSLICVPPILLASRRGRGF